MIPTLHIHCIFPGLEQEIDIMGTVLHIRNQRFGMVQTEVSERYDNIHITVALSTS